MRGLVLALFLRVLLLYYMISGFLLDRPRWPMADGVLLFGVTSEFSPSSPITAAITPQDQSHLGQLVIGHYVFAGVAALTGLLPLLHVGVGIAMVLGKFPGKAPPVFAGWFFVGMGGLAIVIAQTLAILAAFAGKYIAKRRNYRFCFVVAVLCCMQFPLGTALGVASLLVLTRPAVKGAFIE